MTSPKKSAMPAKKRGMIGAAIGFIVFLVLALFSDGTNLTMQIIYMIAGAFYGFGFTFANWKIVMEETKKGAIEGAAGLGIGIILSKLFDNKNWGIFGWLFFLFRISWHLGFCWIPGIAYGIRLIREEAVQEQKVSSAVSPKPAPVHAPGSVSNPTPVPASPPTLRCTNGIFSGAEIPLQTGEEILIGSDAALCQLVLPADYAAPVQCQIRFDTAQNRWLVKDLSGGNTFINGIFPIQSPDYQPIASGVALCIGQGKNCQRFQLG